MADQSPFASDAARSLDLIAAALSGGGEAVLERTARACITLSAQAPDPDEEGAPLWTLSRPLASDLRQGFHTLAGAAALAGQRDISTIAYAQDEGVEAAIRAVNAIIEGFRNLRQVVAAADRAAGDIRRLLAPAGADAATEAIDPEMVDVLRGEIDGYLLDMSDALDRLAADPADQGARRNLERLFHTIKGSAAAIGLTQVAEQAAGVQHVLAAAHAWSGDRIGELAAQVDAILSQVGLPAQFAAVVSTAVSAASTDDQGDVSEAAWSFDEPAMSVSLSLVEGELREADADPELVAVFTSEFVGLKATLDAGLERVRAGGTDLEAISDLRRAWHTLKGSAAAVGLLRISALGKRYQDGFEHALAVRVASQRLIAASARDVERIAVALGLMSATDAAVTGADAEDDWAFSDEDVQVADESFAGVFTTELSSVMATVSNLVEGIAAGEPGLWSDLVDLTHRLKGSAITACADDVAALAIAVWEHCRHQAALPTIIDAFLALTQAVGVMWTPPVLAQEPGSMSDRSQTPTTFAIRASAPADDGDEGIPAAVLEAFIAEAGDLVDDAERIAMLIDDDQDPKARLRDLMRVWHTMKGAANATGFRFLGAALHLLEDRTERWLGASVLPPPARLGTGLRQAQGAITRSFQRIRSGGTNDDPIPAVQVALAQIDRGGAEAKSTATPAAAGTDSGTDSSRVGHTTGWDHHGAERRFVRVAVDHLDALMEIAGELVTARSRLMGRVSSLRSLQNDLRSSHARLERVVGGFNDRHEFSLRKRRGGNGAGSGAGAFGELELDVYDDVNILSRQISEISDDVSDVQRSIAGVLDAVGDDGRAFTGMVGELQGRVTTARMIPAQTLFDRLRMPIRDAAVAEGKEVAVAVEGGMTALDKGMIDGLYAPLLHLVRNAVAHGIESPELRARVGKDRRGTVTITATQEAGQIIITVGDDGAGLDLDRLRHLGLERGLIRADAGVREISELVFAPGLSTRATADELAGRGVGGDVVRRDIERLGGRVQVTTRRGYGTSFTMTLPLTMAIARALVVREGDRRYAIPVAFITRIVALADDPSVTGEGIIVGGEGDQRHCVAWTPLSALLRQPVVPSSMAVVMRVGANLAAVSVEAVDGQDEIVIKPMEGILAGNPAVVGLTIDASGYILPVLDAPGLIDLRSRSQLPLSSPSTGAMPEELALPSTSNRSRRRVFFADDATSVRKVAEKFFAALNVDVVFAVDGADAYGKLGADADFDLVFTDLEMPRMNGFDLIRDLRRARRFDHLPIVVVTSRTGRKHREQAAQLGADDYLTKPFSQDILAATLERLVGSRTQIGAR